MNPLFENQILQTRRQFFGQTGLRLGGLAMASMFGADVARAAASAVHPALPRMPHFPGKAKAVIYLHMNGGPSQLDLWDYKPNLKDQFDKDLPKDFLGERITTMTSGQGRFPVAPSKFAFAQHGQCGRWVSELLPHTAKIVDDIALVKTVHTNAINHDPACTFAMTGSEVPGKPSMGSWISYGLGAETSDLPAFVALMPTFPNGGRDFFRASTVVWCCGRGVIRCCIWRIRRGWMRWTGGQCWMRLVSLTRGVLPDLVIRIFRRGFLSMRWLTGCSRAFLSWRI
jgi:hypothetical protein